MPDRPDEWYIVWSFYRTLQYIYKMWESKKSLAEWSTVLNCPKLICNQIVVIIDNMILWQFTNHKSPGSVFRWT